MQASSYSVAQMIVARIVTGSEYFRRPASDYPDPRCLAFIPIQVCKANNNSRKWRQYSHPANLGCRNRKKRTPWKAHCYSANHRHLWHCRKSSHF